MTETEERIVLECKVKYVLQDGEEEVVTGEEARVQLTDNGINLLPMWGDALRLSLREIISLSAADHRIYMGLCSGEQLTLFHFGYQYDDFWRRLSRIRNEILIKDLLMQESLVRAGLKAKLRMIAADGNEQVMPCELRLYETALVVIGEDGIRRIPYSFISSVKDEDYKLSVDVEGEGQYVFSHLGERFDVARKALSEILNQLALNTQQMLRELIPDASGASIRRASRLLKDGRAVKWSQLEAVCPELWSALEQMMDEGQLDKFRFLEKMAARDRMYIGIKRGLMGDLTGEYIWFLIPVVGSEPDTPGNALIMETAGAAGGRATYCFRLTGRQKYRELAGNEEVLSSMAHDLVQVINRCMLIINFRREPIYVSDEQLRQPRFARYRPAIAVIKELGTLRKLFIGRVIHYNREQWQGDVMDLLRFNVSADDDDRKWRTDDDEELEAEAPDPGMR